MDLIRLANDSESVESVAAAKKVCHLIIEHEVSLSVGKVADIEELNSYVREGSFYHPYNEIHREASRTHRRIYASGLFVGICAECHVLIREKELFWYRIGNSFHDKCMEVYIRRRREVERETSDEDREWNEAVEEVRRQQDKKE
jgi:hypothetical protein